MTCDEVRALILAGDEEAAASHLAACAGCRTDAPDWRRWRSLLAEASLWEEPPPDLPEKLVAAIRRTPSKPERRAGSRRGWEGWVAAAAVAVLMASYGLAETLSPDWSFEMATNIAGASALVDGWNSETGTRMRLRVAGIEPAPPGHYYEIWLTAPDGRHVSAGTFRDAGTVEAWAAVRRADFPRIWITLEPVDDDLGPSPDTYFDTVG
ncbi:MAG TPA: anti-sigma factor [Acidimicrobiia bacterium]|nr:anti-sigma factor [Acidimicrobiia bacterium]